MTYSKATRANKDAWPELPSLADWKDTLDTIHMWSQIVGKIRLELAPHINHAWGSTLYVTTRGLTTSPIPHGMRTFSIDFDFVEHALHVTTSGGLARSFPLKPMSVAAFYKQLMHMLGEMDIEVVIFTKPVEVEVAIPFEQDTIHTSYDADAVNRFWRALVQTDRVFTAFRAGFIGKVSPVHFFWGSFDLAVTRFSGRSAPKHPGGAPNVADRVMVEAYSKELASAGFWAGAGLGEAAFYAYAYPEPDGYRAQRVRPGEATFNEEMGLFVLPYEAVRTAEDPDASLLAFLNSTYDVGADLAKWDRAALEGEARPL